MTEQEKKYEIHLIAIAGDQNPLSGDNRDRVQAAAEKIVDLLQPAGLWVVASPDIQAVQTADLLNTALDGSSLDQTAQSGCLEKGYIVKAGQEDWLRHIEPLNSLAMIKNKHRGSSENVGLVLVTSPDIVEQLPLAVGAENYQHDVDPSYGAVNYIKLEVDSIGRIISGGSGK